MDCRDEGRLQPDLLRRQDVVVDPITDIDDLFGSARGFRNEALEESDIGLLVLRMQAIPR